MSEFVFFNNQCYKSLNKVHHYQNLFVDPTFPPNEVSIGIKGLIHNSNEIIWKRPREICENPRLFIDGCSTKDVCQGYLGNCWLISSIAALALHPKCLIKVIPHISKQEKQFTHSKQYTGMFYFRMWRHGEWIEVIIDDYLPTKNGNLFFAHSKVKNEFWCALLEKAYAKVSGCYESLIGGQEEEALVDFTGGMPEQIFEINKFANSQTERNSFFKLLQNDLKAGSLICSSITSHSGKSEEVLSNGLITTHAYSVTGVVRVFVAGTNLEKLFKDDLHLCRLRNPWGAKEWNGDFSDGWAHWDLFSAKQKAALTVEKVNDGEFWMSFKDFVSNFDQVTVVRLINESKFSYNANWFGSQFNGYWTSASETKENAIKCAGGEGQYILTITKRVGEVLLIHLLQKCLRGQETALGLIILQVEENRISKINHLKWGDLKLEFRLGGSRAICLRCTLRPGIYVLVPYLVKKPHFSPLFYIMRCFTTTKNYGRLLLDELPSFQNHVCSCSPNMTRIISRLRLDKVEYVKVPEETKSVFCEIICENNVFRSIECSSNGTLIWNQSFLFYRQFPQTPIVIKVVEANAFKNLTLGCVVYRFDPRLMNSGEAIASEDQLFEADFQAPCKRLKKICVNWFHTDDARNL